MLPKLLLACTTAVWAATYSVNAGGNWNAYKTSLQPGDTLTLKPQTAGQPYTYTLSGTNQFVLNGSPTMPIVVQGAPGETITLQMDACQNVVELKGKNFIFQNLRLTVTANGQGAIGLRLLPNVSNAIINKVTIHDIAETAFSANTGGGYYDNVTFSNCEAYNIGGTGECFYVGCANAGSTEVLCQFTNGFLINNYCHDTCKPNACTGGSYGSGYQVKGWGSYNNVVRNNMCSRVSQVCILLYDDFDLGPNLIEGNWIYGSVMDAGIQVSAGAIIRYNVIVGNQNGIVLTTNGNNLYPGRKNRNIVLVGNTIVNNGANGVGLDIPTLTPATGSRVVNNIIVQDSGTAINVRGSQTGVTWSNNAYYGGSSPVAGQIQVGSSSTLFQDVAGNNFHPKAGSAVLGAGAPLTAADATTDYSCVTRNTADPTIGAYESTTGPALTTGFQTPCGTPTAPPSSTPPPSNNAPAPTPKTSAAPTAAPTTACSTINCGAHGACTDPNPVCVCSDSYTGSRCETAPVDPCVGNPPTVNCGSHGTCSSSGGTGMCTCFGNWTGTRCTTAPPPTCFDGVQNSDEDGIDCGGTVAKCAACPTFYWMPNAWGSCTVTCGGGTHTRTVDCISSANGGKVTADKCASAAHTFVTTEACNPDPCATYSWRAGAWEACSAACGTGFATRAVDCISSAGNVTVPDNMCTAAKPVTTQNCNTVACVAPHWVTGAWATCSLDCGGGTQTRTRQCFDATNTMVGEGLCPTPAPSTSQPCNLDACVNYNWKACPTFYPCTAQCNGGGAMVGQQFRDVFCIRDSDNAAVDSSLCNGTTQPPSLLSVCNTQPCTGYNWMADANFGPCILQPNGLYQRFRTFHCHAADGATQLRKMCEDNAGKLPIAVLPCTLGTCASPDGCPIVEIADVFNQCDVGLLLSCSVSSECGAAANLLDAQLKSLGFSANPASSQKCVNDYVNSLSTSDRPTSTLLDYVNSRVLAVEALCIPLISGALNMAPSGIAIVVLALAKMLYCD